MEGMTTELLLATGTQSWDEIKTTVAESVTDLIAGNSEGLTIAAPQFGKRIDAAMIEGGELRLIAAGNDSLSGENRLAVRDERAVIAVGFKVTSDSWGTFQWDWSTPVIPKDVASGIVRTMRDIYKTSPEEVEVVASI